MNWLTNVVRPKIRTLFARRTAPENLWHQCPACEQMIFHRDLIANLKVCPHCSHEVDIFSKGGAELMAKRFDVPFLGSIALDPEVRKSGDGGKPVVLEGENSPHAKSIYEFARKVVERVGEIKANAPGNVIQIQ